MTATETDPYDMGNACVPFDNLDTLVERLTFIEKKLCGEPGGKDHELISMLAILAREVKALKARTS